MMAGHNLQIQIQSTGQVDQITISDEAVDLLMPGTPQESVMQAKQLILQSLVALLQSRKGEIVAKWQEANVTTST